MITMATIVTLIVALLIGAIVMIILRYAVGFFLPGNPQLAQLILVVCGLLILLLIIMQVFGGGGIIVAR